MIRTKLTGKVVPVLLAATLLVGVGIGVAQAATQPAVTTTLEIPERTVSQDEAVFPKNDAGQTYGIPREIKGQVAEPDLISAYATNGRIGFINNSERKVATGDPSLFKSPEEALKWQENRGNGPVTVPVYEVDGVTQIGVFEFSTGQPTGKLK